MFFLKKLMLVVSLFLVSNIAVAAVYNLAPSDIDSEGDYDRGLGFIGSGPVEDYFDFTLVGDWNVTQSVFNISGVFSFLNFEIRDKDTNVLVTAVAGTGGKLNTPSFVLQDGDYRTKVFGDLLSSEGGYTLRLAVSPVPEASSIAMMLGGLGLVGFMARRRKAV